jgi:arylsulfatase A-like enzyme
MQNLILKNIIHTSTILILLMVISLPGYAQKGKGKSKDVANKPNIVLIMADDLAFSDIGSYGSEIDTPNLDKLAQGGMRFKQFYNNAICAPTRASLLSGQYQHVAGMGYFDIDMGTPAYQGYLSKQTVSLAEVLKEAGYSTLLSGKWHVGADSTSQWPRKRGFDRFYGNVGGYTDYFAVDEQPEGRKNFLVKDDQIVYPEKDDNFYYTDEITKNAIGFLKDQRAEKKPFFLYLAYTSPHWPLQAWPEDIKKYEGKYDMGWDSLRILRFKNLQEKGLLSENQKISAKPKNLDTWSNLTYDEQRLWARKMEVYAAQVDNLDQNVGRMVAHLKESGQLDNTIIFFISDNGAAGEDVAHGFNGKVRNSGTVGTAGSFDSFNINWAYAANTPHRSFKGFHYEGGISSPFIAYYPAKIAAGGLVEGNAHLIDIAPTLYELAGAKYPKQYKGNTIQPLPGESLLPVLSGNAWSRAEPLYWERAGNKAIRKGKWKLVSVRSDNWELYDISRDRGETNNLIGQHPEVAKELLSLYDVWAKRVGVEDWKVIGKGKGFEPSFNP